MKALVRIFLPLCIFSFIAFGLTCMFLPRNQVETTAESGSASYTVDGVFNKIKAQTSSYDLYITPWNESYASIEVDESIKDRIVVGLNGDTLDISTKYSFDFFNWFKFGEYDFDEWLQHLFSGDLFEGARVTVYVPEKTYEKLELTSTSGSIASEYIAANEVKLKLTSGSVEYIQPTEHKANKIELRETSGSATLRNAFTDEYDVHLTSGVAYIYSLTGNGRIDLTSGNVEAVMAELNGDCTLKTTSGNIELTIPEYSSATIEPSITSGDLYVNVGGIDEYLDDRENVKIGSGTYTIYARMTSGDIEIRGSSERAVTTSFTPAEAEQITEVVLQGTATEN